MSKLTRFSIAISEELSLKFDRLIKKRGYENRSEAFRDIVRRELVDQEWEDGSLVSGTITLIYDHHKRNLLNQITDLQHKHGELIISTSHVHIDHHNCLEVIIVKGESKEIQKFADKLIGTKGVVAGDLVRLTTGKEFN